MEWRGAGRIRSGVHARNGAPAQPSRRHEKPRARRRYRSTRGGARFGRSHGAPVGSERPNPRIAMNKSFRQGQILQIVRSKGIYTQDELARELGERGVQTTQVTLSRDMREIGLVKTADGYRQLAAEKGGPELASVVDDHMQDIRVAQNLVVLKTSPGNANSLAIAID